jgi:hypothetical protein
MSTSARSQLTVGSGDPELVWPCKRLRRRGAAATGLNCGLPQHEGEQEAELDEIDERSAGSFEKSLPLGELPDLGLEAAFAGADLGEDGCGLFQVINRGVGAAGGV